MRIGIAYDTANMYNIKTEEIYYDFAEQSSIDTLKHSLTKIGYDAELVGNTENVVNLINANNFNFDLIYNTVEGIGSRNREGLLPAILEVYKVPYIGTDSFGLSLTLDKNMTKILAEKLNILTPKYFYIDVTMPKEQIKEKLKSFPMPLILKPNYEGNSSGICVEKDAESAYKSIINLINKYCTGILCEEFIVGREITVPVIGNNKNDLLLVPTTVDIQNDGYFWLDINCKVFGDYKNILLDYKNLNKEFFNICQKLFFAVGCKDFARFDFRIDKNDNIYFIEINPLPALFKGGSFDVLGQSLGFSFEETLDLIIRTARKRLKI